MKSIVVRAFLFNNEGKILLTRHQKNSLWVLPGGHLENNETLHEGILREIKEEFHISSRFFEIDTNEILHHKGGKLQHFPLPIAIYELNYFDQNGKDKSRIENIFLMETDDTISNIQDNEIAEYWWFDPDEILSMKPNIDTFDFIIEMLENIIGTDTNF